MSELDKIKECLDFFCRRCNEQGFYSPPLQPIVKEAYEAIAALRSEPVAWSAHGIKREDTCVWMQDSDGPWNTSCGKVFEFTNEGPAENEANFCYHCGGALLPEPYSDAAPSRETDQRESSGIRIEGSQSPGSNPAPMHGQSKTGLTGSHPGAPTQAEPALSAEQIEQTARDLFSLYSWSDPAHVAMRKKIEMMRDMALSSLTANSDLQRWQDELINARKDALTARDEGIEAAAKVAEKWNAHSSLPKHIRALKGASHD